VVKALPNPRAKTAYPPAGWGAMVRPDAVGAPWWPAVATF